MCYKWTETTLAATISCVCSHTQLSCVSPAMEVRVASLENDDYPTRRWANREESAASEGWQLTFPRVKCLCLLFNLAAFPPGLCRRHPAPIPSKSSISAAGRSVSGTHLAFSPMEEGNWNHVCQGCWHWRALLLPIPTRQACYACKSLVAKPFQNPSANRATIITRYMCAIPPCTRWEMRISRSQITLLKIPLCFYSPVSHVPLL